MGKDEEDFSPTLENLKKAEERLSQLERLEKMKKKMKEETEKEVEFLRSYLIGCNSYSTPSIIVSGTYIEIKREGREPFYFPRIQLITFDTKAGNSVSIDLCNWDAQLLQQTLEGKLVFSVKREEEMKKIHAEMIKEEQKP